MQTQNPVICVTYVFEKQKLAGQVQTLDSISLKSQLFGP